MAKATETRSASTTKAAGKRRSAAETEKIRVALTETKNYAGAIQSFATAESLVPGDPAALAEKQEARRVEIQFEYEKAMTAGRAAMAAKNYLAASQSFAAAEKLIERGRMIGLIYRPVGRAC